MDNNLLVESQMLKDEILFPKAALDQRKALFNAVRMAHIHEMMALITSEQPDYFRRHKPTAQGIFRGLQQYTPLKGVAVDDLNEVLGLLNFLGHEVTRDQVDYRKWLQEVAEFAQQHYLPYDEARQPEARGPEAPPTKTTPRGELRLVKG